MHPTLPTAEIDIVIKTFEMHLGIKFVGDLLRILNSVQANLSDSDESYFERAILQAKPLTLRERFSESFGKQIKNKIDDT